MKKFRHLLRKYKWKQIYFASVAFLLFYVPYTLYLFAPKIDNPVMSDIPPGSSGEEVLAAVVPTPDPEVVSMISTVDKVMEITGEEPVIATVTDPQNLPDQEFFSLAELGDKILMYKAQKLAVLYRMKEDKIITYAELEFREDSFSSISGMIASSSAF